MYHLSTRHDLPAEKEKHIRKKLAQAINGVLHAITDGKHDETLLPLMQSRLDATELQMKAWAGQPKIKEGAS